jgi:hypothetical protein
MSGWSISYPADEHYKSVALENGVQVVAHPRKVVNIYALNTGGATVYLVVLDKTVGPGALAAANPGTIYPILAASYVAVGTHGGDQFKNGLYLGAYSTAALAIAGGAPDAGNVMLYKADWMKGYLPD